MNEKKVTIAQNVAVLIDGNNIEISIHKESGTDFTMCNFDVLIPDIIAERSLSRLVYFREGKNISPKLAERLHNNFYGVVKPCRKNADIRLTIEAIQLSDKVDTIIIMSGDSDYIELVQHLKSRGLRVEVAAIESSVSKVLIDECDQFHVIDKKYWFKFKP